MTDHPRLTRYTPYVNGTAFMGMLRQNDTHPEMFGPSYDWTQGPYVLASEADAEIDRLRAEVERLTRQATDWQPIETAPHGPACLFWVVPKSKEETWTDTSGRPITAHGEPYIVMGPYGQWGSLWKATHWMPLPSAPTQASTDAPHCPTCECGSESSTSPAPQS